MKFTKLVWCLALLFAENLCFAQMYSSTELATNAKRSRSKFFVINSPSIGSEGPDSILTLDFHRNHSVFFSAKHNFQGLSDFACSSKPSLHYFVSQTDFEENISRLLRFNPSGKIVRRIPFGTPSGASIALVFDKAGNFYAAQADTIFKNGLLFATVPDVTEMGNIATDSKGNLYITKPISSLVFRIDPLGNVTQFADSSQGLDAPYGLAVDRRDNIFVANNVPSAPVVILKFDQSGSPSHFATTVQIQPDIRSMTFDQHGNLYATSWGFSAILKFDVNGKSSVFADARQGLDRPATIRLCPSAPPLALPLP
jgi:hypothetical protein